jgi:hypothetical protein
LGASTANDVVFALKRLMQDGKIEFVTQVAGTALGSLRLGAFAP